MQKIDTAFLYSVMNIGSKVVLFILCLLMSLLFRKQTPAHSLEYKFLILSTPIISIIIYVCLPLQHLFLIDNILFYELLIFCLVLLNIINYISDPERICIDHIKIHKRPDGRSDSLSERKIRTAQ